MRTSGIFECDLPYTDGQIFLGASELLPLVAASAPFASAAAGKYTLNVPASTTANLFANLNQILRTGRLGSTLYDQQQFGTAASQPGPSSVSNTSGPSGLSGRPPITGANLPTLIGPVRGAIPKGLQVNSIDVIYQVTVLALTSATIGLTATQFGAAGAGAVAPIVTNLITLGANGLPTAVAANPVTTRVPVATPAFTITPETELILNLNFVTPATSLVSVYGAVLNTSYNFN